jgi:transposase-like protein
MPGLTEISKRGSVLERGDAPRKWHVRRSTPDELIQRGVRIPLEGERLIALIAHDLGIHPETLRKRVRQAEADIPPRSEGRKARPALEE